MSSKFLILFVAGVTALCAQETPLDNSVKINLPPDSPLTLISANLGESHVSQRGSAVVLDLDVTLTLHNASPNRVRGVSLVGPAEGGAAGGEAALPVPHRQTPAH